MADHPVQCIVTGGQTGVDRAALDVALELGIEHGGWCPKDRSAEDGAIPARYRLRETASPKPVVRTRRNVRDSDATLIIAPLPLAGGTALTERIARELGRPHLVVQPGDHDAAARIRQWLAGNDIATLNVAGPRESTAPGVYAAAAELLRRVLH